MKLNTIEEIIEDIRQGKMVILMDDEDRENEGDLVMAASQVRPEDINFMVSHARGLVCLPMTEARCEQLSLPLMSSQNGAKFSTNFTISIEASEGVTTGISAADRARTIQAAVALNAKPNDIVQPGHIFPIMAQPGGVLNRAGHTEASCDLARLAGFEPAAVIVEILNEDGTMARRPDLEKFAEKHQLKIGTIADLIEYRTTKEKSVEKISECHWPTKHGEFRLHTYRDTIDQQLHFALVKGNPKNDTSTLVRVHLSNSLSDLLIAQRGSKSSWSLDAAIQKISDEGEGIVVILANKETQEELLQKMRQFEQEDKGEVLSQEQKRQKKRTVGIGSQILADLGVSKMRLLSSGSSYTGLAGYGLEIIENITPDNV